MSLAPAQSAFLARVMQAEDGTAGLDVYRRIVRANTRRALEGAYPVLSRLVGEAFFAEMADRYADAHPSRGGDLHGFGAAFATFIGGYAPARQLDYLPDVARLEWAVHRAAFARDPASFDFAALAALSPTARLEARLEPQPGTVLVESADPIVSIWEANRHDRDGALESAWEGEAALVYREGLHVRVVRAGRDAPLLARLLAGHPLGEACRDEADAAALPRWVGAGIFAGLAR
jgi:hypothetical protein